MSARADIAVERRVLAELITKPERTNQFDVTDFDFSGIVHAYVFRAIRLLVERQQPAGPAEVHAVLEAHDIDIGQLVPRQVGDATVLALGDGYGAVSRSASLPWLTALVAGERPYHDSAELLMDIRWLQQLSELRRKSVERITGERHWSRDL